MTTINTLLEKIQAGAMPVAKTRTGYALRSVVPIFNHSSPTAPFLPSLVPVTWRNGVSHQQSLLPTLLEWAIPLFHKRVAAFMGKMDTIDPMDIFTPLYTPEHPNHDPVSWAAASPLFYAHTTDPMDLFRPLAEYQPTNLLVSSHDNKILSDMRMAATTNTYSLPTGAFAKGGHFSFADDSFVMPLDPVFTQDKYPLMSTPAGVASFEYMLGSLAYERTDLVPLTPFVVTDKPLLSMLLDGLGATDNLRMGLVLRYFNLYPAFSESFGGKGAKQKPDTTDPREPFYIYRPEEQEQKQEQEQEPEPEQEPEQEQDTPEATLDIQN